MMIYKNILAFLAVLAIFYILRVIDANACNLKKINLYLPARENQVYIERLEKKKTIYRGISTDLGNALDLAFKDAKKGKCPDLKGLK